MTSSNSPKNIDRASPTHSRDDLEYILVRSERRKTVGFVVEDDGILRVRAPKEISQERIDEMIDAKRSWIRSSLAKWQRVQDARVERQYVEGERFPYLGRNYRLTVVESTSDLALRKGRLEMPASVFELGEEAMMKAFKRFYAKRLRITLQIRVSRFADKLNVKPALVRVLDLKSRWGSAIDNNINFHWKCCMLPSDVLDYVVIHELAHLLVSDHSPAFWAEVAKVMPDYRQFHEWLDTHGGGMAL